MLYPHVIPPVMRIKEEEKLTLISNNQFVNNFSKHECLNWKQQLTFKNARAELTDHQTSHTTQTFRAVKKFARIEEKNKN